MLTALWSGLGDEFAKRWAARVLTPAFAFWAGGLVVLWWHAHAQGVKTMAGHTSCRHHDMAARTAGIAQAVFIVVGLIL